MKVLVILLVLIGIIGPSYAYEPEPVGVDMIEYGIFDPNDNNTHLLKVGHTYDIKAHFKSELDKQVPFRFLVQVLDKDKHWTEPVDEFVSIGTLKPNESKRFSFSWTPQYQGEFRTYVEVSNPDTHGAMGYAPQFDFEVIKPDEDDPFHDYFPTYRIMNLKEQYLIDEPIRPYILKKDLHACNAYRAEILEDNYRVWEYTNYSSCVTAVEPSEIESKIQIPITNESIKLSETGHYTLEVEIGDYELQENFSVVEHATEDPNNNSKYPVPGGGIISDLYPVRKQFEMGINFENLKCNEGHVLLQKYDGSPACVTESTKQKLVERGWTTKDSTIDKSLLENYNNLPEVKEFYETYEDLEVSVKNDYVSYFAGSDDGYFVRMNLMFDENQSITDIDFHCYYQRVHQYELPREDVASKIPKYDCKEHGKTVSTELSFEQKCADNYKLLRDKTHHLQKSLYASATSYVTELDKALDIKKKMHELQCQSKAIEWFHLISGNEISDPTQMQIQRTNGKVGEITNHMLLSPQNAVTMKISAELEQRGIEYKIIPPTISHTDEGWYDPARLCSTLSFDNGTKFYASAVFHPEPLEIIGIFVDLERPNDCQKYYDLPT